MKSDAVVTIQPAAPVTLAAGSKAQASIVITVAEGYHVQANPASDKFLIPLRLQVRAKGRVRPSKPVYPPGQPYRLEGAASDIMTYGGTFRILVPLEAEASARSGERLLQGVIRYQACDERFCLCPASVPFTFIVRVEAPLA